MRNKTVCFSGHRDITDPKLKERLMDVICDLIQRGYVYFGVGGALGFDTIAALCILELKKTYKNIYLIVIVPCLGQEKSWNAYNKAKYHYILGAADKVNILSNAYYNGCMHARNRFLVDNSSVCVCYLNRKTGGTAYTVNYAMKHNLEIINVSKSYQG